MSDAAIGSLRLAANAIKEVLEENDKLRRALVELDTGGGNYMTVRRDIAKLSGFPSMAITVDEHFAKIKEKLERQQFARFNAQECWIYQGDGNDNLESLVCPVVISAPELMALITKSKGGQS